MSDLAPDIAPARRSFGPSLKTTWLIAVVCVLILVGIAAATPLDSFTEVRTGDDAQQIQNQRQDVAPSLD